MCAENLWGSLEGLKKIRTPLAILREQGDQLTRLTQGVLKGRLTVSSQGGDVQLIMSIVAVKMNDYKFDILNVQHGVKIYPVHVQDAVSQTGEICRDEATFLTKVKSILSSAETRRIIESLISQSQS